MYCKINIQDARSLENFFLKIKGLIAAHIPLIQLLMTKIISSLKLFHSILILDRYHMVSLELI